MACSSPDEVLLLLRGSDRVAHDVCGAVPESSAADVQHAIALRKWHDLDPGHEFRAFVVDGALAGVSQRDIAQEHSWLHEPAARAEMLDLISDFFAEHLASTFSLPTYAFDVYVTSRRRVRLIDFNPPGDTTAGLLYDWDELLEGGLAPELRVVSGGAALRPNLAVYGMPYDFVDDSEGSALRQLLDGAAAAGGLWDDIAGQTRQQQQWA